MSQEIKVGKYTLESLTTGMYKDPRITYREYIQNSVDSLEMAMNSNIINFDEARIEIRIDDDDRKIIIYDNGTGIKTIEAYRILTSIGDSKKSHSENRGFRGIGRLGGLSYCNKLRFITSSKGEQVKSIIEYDCKRLKELLRPGEYDDYDLSKVINEITNYKIEEELINEHYFIVEMEGVDSLCGLLDMDNVKSYLRQTAPLPYKKKFIWRSKIQEIFDENNVVITEFPIFIGETGGKLEQLFKPNSDKFYANKRQKQHDELSDIKTFCITDDNDILAIGWYGVCNFYGKIIEKELTGLRVRKGNILIGDDTLLNNIFREDRFNGWVQGEVFIISNQLIPNARRDDFEQNEVYLKLIDELSQKVGDDIVKAIRESSKNRNNDLNKKVNQASNVINEIKELESDGFNSKVEKKAYIGELDKIKKEVSGVKATNLVEEKKKEDILREIDIVSEEIEKSNNYKANQIKDIGKKERKVLHIVTDILSIYLDKCTVDMLISEIKNSLTKGRE